MASSRVLQAVVKCDKGCGRSLQVHADWARIHCSRKCYFRVHTAYIVTWYDSARGTIGVLIAECPETYTESALSPVYPYMSVEAGADVSIGIRK